MADISTCATEGCPLAESCYRKTAKDSVWQSIQYFEGGENCNGYWPNDKDNKLPRKKKP